MLIAENHLQFILEVALIIHVGVLLIFNIIAIPLSLVLFLALVLTVILAVVFGIVAAKNFFESIIGFYIQKFHGVLLFG